MAGLAHVGVGLAAKRIAPRMPVGVLIVAAYVIDILWGVFFFAGLEGLPEPGKATISPWSHGLLMSIVWSALAGAVVALVARDRRAGLVIGLLVFSHWLVDFISHPMSAAFPGDTGLPLLFAGSPLVGLGMWSTQLGQDIGEYGTVLLGAVIYVLTLRTLEREKAQAGHER